jgi:2,3-bisphosphoglycerate-independent phosphoglycerate mutase
MKPFQTAPAGKAALIILDGWGIGAGDRSDAIAQANAPFIKGLFGSVPNARLLTHGPHVGLPEGQMGNSEVGHLNIGAGRIVFQDLVRVDNAIADGSLAMNPVLHAAFQAAAAPGKRLHFMGLVGDGGVHAMQAHLTALCRMAGDAGLQQVFIHAFTDGRDTDPKSALGFVQRLQEEIQGTPARIASICGRYHAMDRDKRWERIRKAYELLVHGHGARAANAVQAIAESYTKGITDEFIEPCAITGPDGQPLATIRPGDTVICFNFRTDRCREITEALTQRAFPEQGMVPLPLHYVTMTDYDPRYTGVEVLFRKDDLAMTLGETVSKAGLGQARLAETEKYPHVTFFFSGGREAPFPGEIRTVSPSPKVATYDLQPEMSATAVADSALRAFADPDIRLVVLNFANPDMVGHTGVFPAIVKAVEATDACARTVVEAGLKAGWNFVIIADHGNADKAVNPDGSPNTAHSMNPVPVFVLTEHPVTVRNGILADVAPTLLELMGLPQPPEMTGKSLLDPRH